MADENNGGGSEASSEEGPPDEGCCMNCLAGTWAGMRGFWAGIVFVFTAICNGVAYCWYPTKERCNDCCDRCHKDIHAEDDEGYTTFEDT